MLPRTLPLRRSQQGRGATVARWLCADDPAAWLDRLPPAWGLRRAVALRRAALVPSATEEAPLESVPVRTGEGQPQQATCQALQGLWHGTTPLLAARMMQCGRALSVPFPSPAPAVPAADAPNTATSGSGGGVATTAGDRPMAHNWLFATPSGELSLSYAEAVPWHHGDDAKLRQTLLAASTCDADHAAVEVAMRALGALRDAEAKSAEASNVGDGAACAAVAPPVDMEVRFLAEVGALVSGTRFTDAPVVAVAPDASDAASASSEPITAATFDEVPEGPGGDVAPVYLLDGRTAYALPGHRVRVPRLVCVLLHRPSPRP